MNTHDRRRNRLRQCAILGFAVSVVNGLGGFALLTASYLASEGAYTVSAAVGNVLLISVIPILLCAAHLMDASERPEGEERPSGAQVVRARDFWPIA